MTQVIEKDKYGNQCYRNEKNEWHRTDGPAIEYSNGDKEWLIHGVLHREDGPAVECANGTKAWYINGKQHRLDGPAVERPGGRNEWWINDQEFSEAAFNMVQSVIVDGVIYQLH